MIVTAVEVLRAETGDILSELRAWHGIPVKGQLIDIDSIKYKINWVRANSDDTYTIFVSNMDYAPDVFA